MTDSNDSPKLPARVGKSAGTGKKSKALDRIRAATPARPLADGLRRADLNAPNGRQEGPPVRTGGPSYIYVRAR